MTTFLLHTLHREVLKVKLHSTSLVMISHKAGIDSVQDQLFTVKRHNNVKILAISGTTIIITRDLIL